MSEPVTEVWVLSDEAPFDDPEGSGGCVCGVFATLAAALFELGTWEIGLEGMADITWRPFGEGAYEGHGHAGAIYILRRHTVQAEATVRAAYAAYEDRHALRPHPYLALSSAELVALLTAGLEKPDP